MRGQLLQLVFAGMVVLAQGVMGWVQASDSLPHPTCLAPYWGGLLAGMSTDAEVTALYGEGRFDPSSGDHGARTFSDPSRKATLIIELGTDKVVSSIEVRNGVSTGSTRRSIASRFRPSDGIGVRFGIHLGDTTHAVRENLGEPTSSRADVDGETWIYESSCACELSAGLSFSFVNGRLVSFSAWALNG